MRISFACKRQCCALRCFKVNTRLNTHDGDIELWRNCCCRYTPASNGCFAGKTHWISYSYYDWCVLHHLRIEDDRTERRAEWPVVDEHIWDEGHRNAERCHQDITARQTDDEIVGYGAHPTMCGDDDADGRVASDRDDGDDGVKDDNKRFGVDGELSRSGFCRPFRHIKRYLQQRCSHSDQLGFHDVRLRWRLLYIRTIASSCSNWTTTAAWRMAFCLLKMQSATTDYFTLWVFSTILLQQQNNNWRWHGKDDKKNENKNKRIKIIIIIIYLDDLQCRNKQSKRPENAQKYPFWDPKIKQFFGEGQGSLPRLGGEHPSPHTPPLYSLGALGASNMSRRRLLGAYGALYSQ